MYQSKDEPPITNALRRNNQSSAWRMVPSGFVAFKLRYYAAIAALTFLFCRLALPKGTHLVDEGQCEIDPVAYYLLTKNFRRILVVEPPKYNREIIRVLGSRFWAFVSRSVKIFNSHKLLMLLRKLVAGEGLEPPTRGL